MRRPGHQDQDHPLHGRRSRRLDSGQHLLFSYDVVQSGEGVGNRLIYIIAAVIGGCLITGGYGSAVGSAVGAFIFGMTSKGIVFAEWNPDWFKFFLGAMLLLATLLNAWVRKRAEATRVTGTEARTALVELSGVSKNYGNVRALEGVSLEVHAGEITCVLGDNGAGKSTLIKIIAGLHQHDGGTLSIDGEGPPLLPARGALDRGIATVYQDLAVVPLMPVWRNFFLRFGAAQERRPLQAHGRRPHAARPAPNSCAWASTSATSTSPSAPSPAASASAWRSPARCTSARRCWCSTSRRRHWA